MEGKDSGCPVTRDFQAWEDSQNPQHKLLLQICQLQVSCLNVILSSTLEPSERAEIFPTFMF